MLLRTRSLSRILFWSLFLSFIVKPFSASENPFQEYFELNQLDARRVSRQTSLREKENNADISLSKSDADHLAMLKQIISNSDSMKKSAVSTQTANVPASSVIGAPMFQSFTNDPLTQKVYHKSSFIEKDLDNFSKIFFYRKDSKKPPIWLIRF